MNSSPHPACGYTISHQTMLPPHFPHLRPAASLPDGSMFTMRPSDDRGREREGEAALYCKASRGALFVFNFFNFHNLLL